MLLFFLGVGACAQQGVTFAFVDEAQWENGEDTCALTTPEGISLSQKLT